MRPPLEYESHRAKKTEPIANSWPQRLSWIALGLALALVIARGTMQEFLRDPIEVQPGSQAVPHGPGPATSVGLDLLCCIPAILILLRGVIDRQYVPRSPWSMAPLALLSVWMLLSTIWAADKFGALVTACHWAAAAALLWAMSQLVRDWLRLRLVAAVLFGLLPMYVIHGFYYRYIDLPATTKMWDENRSKLLAERGLQEGSFAARQFEEKIHAGEMFGYFCSPNTFGAALSLLIVLGTGLLIQRCADSDGSKWGVPTVAIVLALGLWIMAWTRSRGAFATLGIALLLFLLVWVFRAQLRVHARKIFFAGVASVVMFLLAAVGHGISHGRLPTSTLTFRWHYWVGGARVFREHPLLGVGWNNFGYYYLGHRPPQAPEEVKDPHNFLVRFCVELGIIGGGLLIAWLVRLWWELTRPVAPSTPQEPDAPGVLKFVAGVTAAANVIYLWLGVDWAQPMLEILLIRLLFFGVAIIISSLVALRSLDTQDADARPAPWVLYAILLAVGGLLIHNLIDFSLFEVGPMLLFAALAGSALGLRQALPRPQPGTSKALVIALASAVVLWLAVAMFLWAPVLQAQRAADTADDAIRANHLATAQELLNQANHHAYGLNAEYAFRAAIVSPQSRMKQHLDEAIRENPMEGPYYLTAARAELQSATPDQVFVRRNYEKALKLDPNNVANRLEYAKTLTGFGAAQGAIMQYREALRYNDLLNRDEKKRLTPEEVEQIHKKIEQFDAKPEI